MPEFMYVYSKKYKITQMKTITKIIFGLHDYFSSMTEENDKLCNSNMLCTY